MCGSAVSTLSQARALGTPPRLQSLGETPLLVDRATHPHLVLCGESLPLAPCVIGPLLSNSRVSLGLASVVVGDL